MLTASARSLAAPLLLQFRPIGRELRPGHIPRSPDPAQIDTRRTGDTAIQGAPLRPKPLPQLPTPPCIFTTRPSSRKTSRRRIFETASPVCAATTRPYVSSWGR